MVSMLAFLIAHFVSRTAVRPLQRLANLMEQNDKTQHFSFADDFPDNEIGYLANTIENSFNLLQQALTREFDFTRDISHELRTPTAVLKILTKQLHDTGTLKAESRQQLKDSVQQIEHTISVLLALSREESFEKQSVCLLEEIEDCVINHFGLSNRAEFDIKVDVSADYKLKTNKNLLHILIINLLDNVLNHGNANRLSISLTNDNLVFQNPIDYKPVGNLLEPAVKSQSSKGVGIGLNLVKRICDCFDWQVSTSTADHLFPLTIQFK